MKIRRARVYGERAQRPRGSRRGSAMVEFALCATLLTTMFTGVFRFGYQMYVYNELVSGVRSGVRYASLAEIDNSGSSCGAQSAYTTAVQNMVVYGSTTTGTQAIAPNLATSAVTVTPVCAGSGSAAAVPTSVTVSISSYTIDAVVASWTVTGKPAMTMPYFGKYCSTNGGANSC
jgi:Flp pilus assembly protein TadG